MTGSSLNVLNLLLEQAQAERDAAAQALHGAQRQADAARAQHGELSGYRSEYQQRWSQTFAAATTMDIVACYQSFGQRLNHAIDSQGHVASTADQRAERARNALLAAELRVAALGKLIERRGAESLRKAQRAEQNANDEFAARVHATQLAAGAFAGR
jgi:flagellar FliJ protein